MSANSFDALLRRGVNAAALLAELGLRLGPSALRPWRLGGDPGEERSDREHLDAALSWLCRSQDACGGRGSASMFALLKGWQIAYPETSGYIIATFLAAARLFSRDDLRERAIALAEWELDIQAPNGGVLSSPDRPETRVFNTGQVVLGLCALFEETREERYLGAAATMGRYLASLQEDDGRWERDTYCGARTYQARVDWALLRVAALTGDRRHAEVAARNLAWVTRQATPNGWFLNCGFHGDAPITHVIGYTLRGLLESHALGDAATAGLDLLGPVRVAAANLAESIDRSSLDGIPGLLPGSFESDWSSRDRWSCLTGNAQLSIVFARLSRMFDDPGHARAARALASAAKRAQRIAAPSAAIRGALAGSHPLGGGYIAFSFPNWATKFLADALLFQLRPDDAAFNVPA